MSKFNLLLTCWRLLVVCVSSVVQWHRESAREREHVRHQLPLHTHSHHSSPGLCMKEHFWDARKISTIIKLPRRDTATCGTYWTGVFGFWCLGPVGGAGGAWGLAVFRGQRWSTEGAGHLVIRIWELLAWGRQSEEAGSQWVELLSVWFPSSS